MPVYDIFNENGMNVSNLHLSLLQSFQNIFLKLFLKRGIFEASCLKGFDFLNFLGTHVLMSSRKVEKSAFPSIIIRQNLIILTMIVQFNHENSIFQGQSILKANKNIHYSTSANTSISPYQQTFQKMEEIGNTKHKISNLRKSKVSLAAIREKLKEIEINEEKKVQKKQKNRLDKVLELLREQRLKIGKIKEQKRKYLSQVWRTFGTLMGLQKEKTQTDFMCLPSDKAKQKLYNQLLCKNEHNLKSSNSFFIKLSQTTSQNKLKFQQLSLNLKRTEHRDQTYEYPTKQNLNAIMSSDRKYQSLKLVHKSCPNKIRSRPMPFRFITKCSNQQCQNDEIKAKVEQTFKTIKKNKVGGENILNNIVFDPDRVFSSEKRKYYFKNIQKRPIHRLDMQQKNTKILLRVGGMKLSLLQSKYYKTIQN